MPAKRTVYTIIGGLLVLAVFVFGANNQIAEASAKQNLLAQGRQTFRFDTFGDEAF